MESELREKFGEDGGCQTSSCVHFERGLGNPTPLPGSESLQVGNEKLKTLLAQRDVKNEVLTQKIRRLEGELVWEIGAPGDMILEMVKMKELLQEKDVEIQELKKALRKEGIQKDLRTTEKETQLMYMSTSKAEEVLQRFPDVIKTISQIERKASKYGYWRKLLPVLTTCRLVCKSWEQSVDLLMQQEASQMDLCAEKASLRRRVHEEDFAPYPLKLTYKSFENLRWTDKLKIISHELKANASYNPVPSRHLLLEVVIEHDDPEKWNEYCGMVTRYLQVLGKEVWNLTVNVERLHFKRDAIVDFQCLSEWFRFVNNIKSLSFYTTVFELNCITDFGKVAFPKLGHLTTLQCFRDAPLLTYNSLKNNRHIRDLGIYSDCGPDYPTPSPNFMDIDFPNLSSLNCNFHDVDDWKKFVNVSWKLEELSVWLCACHGPTRKSFYEGLEKFGNTLTSLTFNFSQFHRWYYDDKRDGEAKLNLPQLRSLHLICEDWQPDPLESILAPLNTLETFSMELSVELSGGHFEHPSGDVRESFVNYVDNFEQEMDWMKLPNLRDVTLIVKLYGRGIGVRDVFVVRRTGLPSVRFDVVKIDEVDDICELD